MPLHLLSKKSWNVYAPENIARVQHDQAEAQAREEEDERRLQEHDSKRRLAVLRGEVPPATARDVRAATIKQQSREAPGHIDNHRKRKRLHGENDTDRDLRLARENLESRPKGGGFRTHSKRGGRPDAPITDSNGHINLFPVDRILNVREYRNKEAGTEKDPKHREPDDQSAMRFSKPARMNGPKPGPWYVSDKGQEQADMDFVKGKDIWGKSGPSASDREHARQSVQDPFAIMQEAQSQFKLAKRERNSWEKDEQGGYNKVAGYYEQQGWQKQERSRGQERGHKTHRSRRSRSAEEDLGYRRRRKDHPREQNRSKERLRHRKKSDGPTLFP